VHLATFNIFAAILNNKPIVYFFTLGKQGHLDIVQKLCLPSVPSFLHADLSQHLWVVCDAQIAYFIYTPDSATVDWKSKAFPIPLKNSQSVQSVVSFCVGLNEGKIRRCQNLDGKNKKKRQKVARC